MTYLPNAAHRLLARQHGVASTEQLLDTGLSRRQIEHLERRGSLRSIVRGSYGTPSVEITEHSRCAAISLARPQVVVAGPTAGRIHGFRKVSTDRRIHLVAPPGANPSTERGITTFHTLAIRDDDKIERSDGIRVTTPQRTALDLSRFLVGDDLLSVIEQAMKITGCTDADMRAVAAEWLPRRPWVRRFWDALDRRLAGPAAESHPEVVVGRMLAELGVAGIVRQHPIELPGYGSARFDLATPWARWALEVDVFPTHEETVGIESDRHRDRCARQLGWTVSRITRTEYETNLAGALAAAVATHHRAARRIFPASSERDPTHAG